MTNRRGNRFVWYELLTTDVQAAKAFYAQIVGWTARDIPMPGATYSLFDAAGSAVAGLVNMPESVSRAGAVPHWMGYAGIDNLDLALAKVVELGGAIRVPPRNISDISRFSIVADPQEATFALVKGAKPNQAPNVELGTPGHVGWHELFATDAEKAFPFYSKLFGWRRVRVEADGMDTYQPFAIGDETIGNISKRPETVPVSFWLHYFNVADIEVAAKRIEESGGIILYGPLAASGGVWIAHCKDPQGALFGILDRRSRKVLEAFAASRKRSAQPRKK